jgi:hypothetical protein
MEARKSHMKKKSVKIKWKGGRTDTFLVLETEWLNEI